MTSVLRKVRLIPQKIYEVRHGDEPWIAKGVVRYLDERLTGLTGLEWGSGRSTAWFGARLGRLVSVEDNQGWYERVKPQLDSLPNVDLRLLSIDGGAQSPYVRVIDDFEDGSLDFALVDGQCRHACVTAAKPKMRPGGLLAVDNTDWPQFSAFLANEMGDWEKVCEDRNARSQTTVWRAPGLA